MAIPSSPPAAIPLSPPSSPPTFPVTFPRFHSRRKRHFDDNLSSDPLFSEDVSESDEHVGASRKRLYKGPWWGHSRQDRPLRDAAMFADSGVWLASESSDDGFLRTLSSDRIDEDAQMPLDDKHLTNSTKPSTTIFHDTTTSKCSSELSAIVHRIVATCIDDGNESIDLSGMSLKAIEDQAFHPLQQMVLTRSFDDPDSDSFIPMTPQLRIFLSGNGLSSLPNSLWKLENTTVLSVRNNDLGDLSNGVGRLSKLKELNIAGNRIRWLPWDLLGLIRRRQGQTLRITTHPNPLIQPVSEQCLGSLSPISFANPPDIIQRNLEASFLGNGTSILTPEQSMLASMVFKVAQVWTLRRSREPNDLMAPVFGGATRVLYYDTNGSLCRRPKGAESSSVLTETAATTYSPQAPIDGCRAPSLFESSLRAFRRHYASVHPTTIADLDVTESVANALSQAIASKQEVQPTCSVCDRPYIIKRAQWIEFWHCNMTNDMVPPHLLFLPFMRRACSWVCVDRAWEAHNEQYQSTIAN